MSLHLVRRRVVLREVRDADGYSYRAVELRRGRLHVVGHDLGGQYDEYEFERRLSRNDTAALARALDVRVRDLLEAVRERFGDTPDLEAYCREHGLEGELWNRIG
jgi:hypothetical protein